MSGRGKYRSNRQRNNLQSFMLKAKETAVALPEDSPVLALFKDISLELIERQDRHERLVKLSRDITIESKRVIFLLHSAITEEATEKAVKDANERLRKLVEGPIRSIGLELEHCPAYLHSRAVTAGFQEFIEAKTFCSLMDRKVITTYKEVQKELEYKIKEEDSENERTVVTFLPRMDYMLGLADLTGELMRRAINSISTGAIQECHFACQIIRKLYTESLGLSGMGKELSRKMSVTRSNLIKVEAAEYALSVRGSEAPTLLMLRQTDWEDQHNSDDEGFF